MLIIADFRSVAYVELASVELVSKALTLSGTIVMGLPIMIALSESEKNITNTIIPSMPGAPMIGLVGRRVPGSFIADLSLPQTWVLASLAPSHSWLAADSGIHAWQRRECKRRHPVS